MKAITGVTLIDGLGSKPIHRATILIENGTHPDNWK